MRFWAMFLALLVVPKDRAKGKQPDRKAFVEALADARKKLDARSDALFAEKLSALVFYVGATGLLPDDLTLPLLWCGLLVNLQGLITPLGDAVLGAEKWCIPLINAGRPGCSRARTTNLIGNIHVGFATLGHQNP